MSDLRTELLPAPWKGMASADAPDAIDKSEAVLLENMLPGSAGLLRLRGPIGRNVRTPTSWTAGSLAQSFWVYNSTLADQDLEWVLLQRDAVSDSTYYEFEIAEGNAEDNFTNLGGGTYDSSAMAEAMRSMQLGSLTYGGVKAIETGPPVSSVIKLYKWKPDESIWTGGSARTFTEVTNAPYDFKGLAVHLNRLFVLGGSVPGTTTPAYDANLYLSDQDGPDAGTLAQWQDDSSSVVNQIQVLPNGVDTGVGMAHVGRDLALLFRRSIWMLRGQTPSTFQAQQFTAEYGCVSDSSILEYGAGFFFASDHGYMYCDGVTIQEVSAPIRTDFKLVLDQASDNATDFTRRVSAAYVGNNTITVCVGNGSSGTTKTWLYHVPSGTWSEVTVNTNIITIGTPVQVVRTATNVAYWNGTSFFTANHIADASPPDELGAASLGLDSPDEFTTTYRVPAKIYYRLAKLASPYQMARIERVMLDYMLESDSATDGWSLQLRDGAGTVLLSWQTLDVKDDSDADLKRLRRSIEIFNEAHDVQLQLELRTTATVTVGYNLAEIYDAWLLYQPAFSFINP